MWRVIFEVKWFGTAKKGKFRRPDKVSLCKICGVRTADVDWHTSSNDAASEFSSWVEARNNSGSTTVYNDSADRFSG